MDKRKRKCLVIGLLVLALFIANIIARQLPLQLDLTEDKIYTLSAGTRSLLQKVEAPIHLKFYFSRSSEGMPILFKNYASQVEGLLRQYVRASRGMLSMEVIDPKPDTEEEITLVREGIKPQPLPSGDSLAFGLVAIQAEQEQVIPLFNLERERLLEFDISRLLFRVQQTELPVLGLLSSLSLSGPNNPGESAVIQELSNYFQIQNIQDLERGPIPDTVDILAVIHPQKLAEATLYAIDQFVLSGKPTFMAVDPSSYFQRAQSNAQGIRGSTTVEFSSDMPRLFKAWGIEYDADLFIADLQYATPINLEGNLQPRYFPAWLTVNASLRGGHPTTNEIDRMLLPEVGSFALSPESSLDLFPLLISSPEHQALPSEQLLLSTPETLARSIVPSGKPAVIGGLIRGAFPSAFPEPLENSSTSQGRQHLGQSAEESILFLIADTDFLADSFTVRLLNFLGLTTVQPFNDNIAFTNNIIDFLFGSEDLISLRSKGESIRPFVRVNELARKAEAAFQMQLEALETRLQSVQQELNELQAQGGDGSQLLISPEIQNKIETFRAEEVALRSERRLLRKNLREDIESLDRTLALFNLIPLTILILVFGTYYCSRRNKANRQSWRTERLT